MRQQTDAAALEVEREDEEKRRLVRKRREEGRLNIANRLVVGLLLIK